MEVEACVDRQTLSIDPRATVEAILRRVREADAPAPARALPAAGPRDTGDTDSILYVADGLAKIGTAEAAPGVSSPDALADRDLPRELEKLRFLTVHDLAYETSSESYLDEGRGLTALRVARPFHTTGAVYRWPPDRAAPPTPGTSSPVPR